jgi:penicillin-binding protein 1C
MIWWNDYYIDNWQVNSIFALRQVWSTLKPFTYTLAFKDLWYNPSTIITDLPIQFDTQDWNTYSPKNYSLDYKWEVSLAQALSQSINIPAIKLTKQIWLNRLHEFLKELWISSLNKDSSYYWLALTLWVWEISLFELVRAYTIFSNDWKICKLNIVKNKWNDCHKIIEKKYTDMTNSILSNRYFKLWWFPINSNLDFKDRNVFVKTWTSRNFVDNYSIWYTNKYLIWIWVWNKDWTPMKWVSWSTWAWEIFRKIVYELESWYIIPKTIIQNKIGKKYLEIISPLNNSTYKIDNTKPKEIQKIWLDFKTNIIYDRYKWNINNKELKNDFWQIEIWNFEIKLELFKNNEIILVKKSYIDIIK